MQIRFLRYNFNYPSDRPARLRAGGVLIGLALFLGLAIQSSPAVAGIQPHSSQSFLETIQVLSSFGDRSTGTAGSQAAADYIEKRFNDLGFDPVGTHFFSVPMRVHGKSTLSLPGKDLPQPIHPLKGNAVSPGTISPQGLRGPLVYVGSGDLKSFNGKVIAGAIILMELDSGKNWLQAANLGAKALIYIDRGKTPKTIFQEKFELSPFASHVSGCRFHDCGKFSVVLRTIPMA